MTFTSFGNVEDGRRLRSCSKTSPAWCRPVNQWSRLTRFYEVPGVPLDSNLVEQALVIPVRYLAGSFNYQTKTGAEVGDRIMSLVATARANGLEPVAYLTACLREHAAVAKTPEDFLPWNFRRRQEDPSTRRLPSPW